jgi:hypothetical protein
VASDIAQHFEGTAPPKSRLWIVLLSAVVLVVLFVMFARATLPGQRREFVGLWKEVKKPQFFYDFRADGSFTALIQNDWVGNYMNGRVEVKGTWKASHEALYLTYTSMDLINKTRGPDEFAREAREQIGREIKIQVDWVSKDQIHIGPNWDWIYQRS